MIVITRSVTEGSDGSGEWYVFRQGDDMLAIVELPGVEKKDLQIEAKENSIRIFGKKTVEYPDDASLHRRERLAGEFDRTLSLPVEIDPVRQRH